MNKKIKLTLLEFKEIALRNNFHWLLTRLNPYGKPNDLDILVSKNHYQKIKVLLFRSGYNVSSHDAALGGRIPDAQVNCTKVGRYKIDLHQEFTWRKTVYVSERFIWEGKVSKKIEGVTVPTPAKEVDAFLVAINVIFEKTYINFADQKLIDEFYTKLQAQKYKTNSAKYGWGKTWSLFLSWHLMHLGEEKKEITFIPIWLILFSYGEKSIADKKIDLISLSYYFFSRIRYAINGVLPYE